MKTSMSIAIVTTVLLFAAASPKMADAQTAAGRAGASVPYRWKSVQMVGGGFVDGIVFHPTAKGMRYCRTDMGGAYRWDGRAKQWMPLLDWVSLEDVNLMGVESIAVDPHDPNRVYLACGTYTSSPNTAILRSDDQGKTFQRTNVPFRMGGNENGRGDGERLVVDPNDGRVLYFGSRQAGLWQSTDRSVTWCRVDSFPDVTEAPPTAPPPQAAPAAGAAGGQRRGGFRPARSSGVVWVLFDPHSGTVGKPSQTIYAGVSLMGRENVYRSTDGGAHWQPVPGQPLQYRPNHGVLSANGILYISYGSSPGPQQMRDGGIWKFDTNTNTWTCTIPMLSSRARLAIQAAKKSFAVRTLDIPGSQSSIKGAAPTIFLWRPTSRVRRSTGCSTSRSIPSIPTTPCSRRDMADMRPSIFPTPMSASRRNGA